MNRKDCKTPLPRDMFERKIRNQFGLSDAVLRAISELRYLEKP